MKLLFLYLKIHLKSFIRYKYSSFYLFLYIVSIFFSTKKEEYAVVFFMIWGTNFLLILKENLYPFYYKTHNTIGSNILKLLVLFPFVIAINNKKELLLILIVLLLFSRVFSSQNRILDKGNLACNLFLKSFVLTYKLHIIYIIAVLCSIYLYVEYGKPLQVIGVSILVNYIYSSTYSLIERYKSDVKLITLYTKTFFNQFSYNIRIEIILLNIPFFILILISDWHRLDVLSMIMINQYFAIKNYYYNLILKHRVFENTIAIGIMSLIPYLFFVQMIMSIVFERKTMNNANR